MKNYTILLGCLTILFATFGCETEKKKDATISKITDNAIHLSDGTTIDFPKPEEKKSVMFIIRPGEYTKESGTMVNDLTPAGVEYAERMGQLFKDIKLNSVLAIGTRFAQNTGRPIADARGGTVYTFNNVDYGPFLDYIYNIELGSKFVVIDLASKIPEIIYTLTAGKTVQSIPDGVFNEVFVVFSSKRGDAEIHRLRL